MVFGSLLIGYAYINLNDSSQYINPGLYKSNIKITKDEFSTGSCLAIGVVCYILAFYSLSIYRIKSILLGIPFALFSFLCVIICLATAIRLF